MNQYLDFFHTQRARIDAHALPLLNAGRDAAAAAFARLGFPSRKMERYRYTDVADVFAPNYGIQVDGKRTTARPPMPSASNSTAPSPTWRATPSRR